MILPFIGMIDPVQVIVSAVLLLTAFPIHEYAHGYAAYKLGDDTAALSGRLSLNPLAHLDPLGAVCMLLFGFGWAKPVPVNPVRFKKVSMKTGMALTALAGPLSNIILAFISLCLYKVFWWLNILYGGGGANFLYFLTMVFRIMTSLNIGLAVFNLLPVPPLDGSRIIFSFLPERLYWKVMRYENYIRIALFALIFLGVLDTPLYYLRYWLLSFLEIFTYPIDLIFKMI